MSPRELTLSQYAQFTGFLDDELGKLSNLSDTTLRRLNRSTNPELDLQESVNPTPLDVLCQYLTTAALFSEPIVVVDGWLLLTPGWWDAFFEPTRYPLIQLLKSGFLVSFSRSNGALADLAERAAARGIRSYAAICRRPEYNGLRRLLDEHDQRGTIGFVRWPRLNMDASLTTILADAIGHVDRLVSEHPSKGTHVWDYLRATFEAECTRSSARQAWLKSVLSCARQFELRPETVRQLAHVGIEAYHRSRALALGAQCGQSVGMASVLSLGSSALQRADIAGGDFLADELLMLDVDFRRIHDFSRLAEVLDPSSKVGALKLRFLATRATALQDPGHRDEYEQAARKYRDALNQLLGPIVEAPRPRLRRAAVGAVDGAGAGIVSALGCVAGVVALATLGPIEGTQGAVLGALGGGMVKHYLGVGWKKLTYLHRQVALPVGMRDASTQLRVALTVNALATQSPIVVPGHITREDVLEHVGRLAPY